MSQESKPNCLMSVHRLHVLGHVLQVKSHPQASLVDKHDVCHHHRHDTLIGASPKSTDNSRPNKAWVTRRECLPDIGQHTYQPTYNNRRTSPENITERNDDKICVSQGNGSGSEQVVDLWEGFVEFLHEDWGKWSDGQRRKDADEDEECLIDEYYRFPCSTPILYS